jgi:hypothetical protein
MHAGGGCNDFWCHVHLLLMLLLLLPPPPLPPLGFLLPLLLLPRLVLQPPRLLLLVLGAQLRTQAGCRRRLRWQRRHSLLKGPRHDCRSSDVGGSGATEQRGAASM